MDERDLSISADAPPLTIDQAIANLSGPDFGSRYYAAWWLGRFRVRTQAAVDALIQALDDESDRTPDGGYPLRRNAARALAKLGNPAAVPALKTCLDCSDYYVREAAAQALGLLGDSSCIDPLTKLLDRSSPEIAASGRSALTQPHEAVLEALGALKAYSAIPLIESFLSHSAELVQYAAARALYLLTQDESYGDRLIQALSGHQLQLRRAALADLGAMGYLNAAEPIARTLAENSLKLISLKGILEHHLAQTWTDSKTKMLSNEARQVMTLMDSLL